MPELTPGPGRFTQVGVGWFVDFVLGSGLPENDDGVRPFLQKTIDEAIAALQIEGAATASTPEDVAPILARVDETQQNRYGSEFWIAAGLANAVRALDALDRGAAAAAASYALHVMRARAMTFFYSNLEPVVWRGYEALGASELGSALRIWAANQENGNEDFWQRFLVNHPFLLTHLIPGSAVIVGERVYVGGKRLDNSGGNIADFITSSELGGNIVLVELKTPTTPLLRAQAYRGGVYAPSTELAGAVSQVLTYRRTLLDEWHTLSPETPGLNVFHPRCYVLAGRYSEVGTEAGRQRSLELYRNSQHDVQIMTFDELFASAEALMRIFQDQNAQAGPTPALDSRPCDRDDGDSTASG